MKYIVVLLSFTLLIACHPGKEVDSQARFTSFYLFLFEMGNRDLQFSFNPGTGVITAKTIGGDKQVNIADLYKRYKASPDSMLQLSMLNSPHYEPAPHIITSNNLDHVIPVLTFSNMPSTMEKYNEELYVSYAESTPTCFKYLSEEEVAKFSLPAVKSRAINNLIDGMDALKTTESRGIYMLGTGEDEVASLILYNPFWDSKKIKVDGDYIVAIPCRGRIFVTGSKDEKGMLKIQELAETAFNREAYTITKTLFRYDGKQFHPFIY